MKVLLPENPEFNEFERQLQTTLEQINVAGYALMGFSFREARGGALHEIDALLLIEPCIFVCLEAKGYSGKWTGSTNQKWTCDGREIKAVGANPYKQVNKYSLVIKERLKQEVFNDITFYVNGIVVAPDRAEIQIQDAVVDRFQAGRAANICHLSKLESVLSKIFVGDSLKEAEEKVREVELKQIVSILTSISVDFINEPITANQPQPPTKPSVEEGEKQLLDEQNTGSSSPIPITGIDGEKGADISNGNDPPPPPIPNPLPPVKFPIPQWVAVAGISLALLCTGAAATQFFWNSPACESTETRINGNCYKDLARTPLRIGILAPPEQYAKFKAYLKEQLGSRALDVVIEGNADIKYAEVQNKIAKQEWDVVFALSPMNSMRAKDNGYIWIARMFPDNPPTYQSALYVRANSPIQSLDDIKTTTKLALGDVNSASTYYMPAYDLFGKSMTVSTGHRSGKIRDLVASGMADMGAGVYSSVKDDPQFRVIHVSRELPGSGVYISPKISAADQDSIRQIILGAPEDIRDEANYGEGQEPDYEVFRTISLRTDEVLSCAKFDQQPVEFFCDNQNNSATPQATEGVTGTITGFTKQGNGIVNLRFKADSGEVCQLSMPLKTMSSIPNGTSPGMINKKRVSLTSVKIEDVSSQNCQLIITEPSQIKVF